MWTVITGKPVKRKLDRIPNPDNERIKKAIRDLEVNPEELDIKPLAGRDEHRLRVGNWRLIMKISEEDKMIFIRTLASRGDVYKK
ncbi:MAG: type II toxin-antitoxin system RelE/ParE family toxin [Synergistaceae bacterium]|nr:type II toxin-antitoxin system RelE/ParE family toxin [Synergistaceae bacterium]